MERRRLIGGILATLGYLLSPLSWWNDLIINIPLAYAFATVVGLISRDLFLPAIVVGYWLTNIVGLVLLHKGAVDVVSQGEKPYTRKELERDVLMTMGYTVLIVILVVTGWITFPEGAL